MLRELRSTLVSQSASFSTSNGTQCFDPAAPVGADPLQAFSRAKKRLTSDFAGGSGEILFVFIVANERNRGTAENCLGCLSFFSHHSQIVLNIRCIIVLFIYFFLHF